MSSPKPPEDLRERGSGFWSEITGAYQLSAPERELLVEVVRTLDVCEALAGSTDLASLREVRQQRVALGRLLAQLAIPESDLEKPMTRRARRAAQARWGVTPITGRDA